jgi:dUTP pyrophosphatase
MITVRWQSLDDLAHQPTQGHAGDAGWDLYALEDAVLRGHGFPPQKVRTGIALQLPEGYAAWVTGRSGLTLEGLIVHLGLIDPSYRGEIGVMVSASSGEYRHISVGQRIAQLVIFPVVPVRWVNAEALETTVRGAAGFGSTGI